MGKMKFPDWAHQEKERAYQQRKDAAEEAMRGLMLERERQKLDQRIAEEHHRRMIRYAAPMKEAPMTAADWEPDLIEFDTGKGYVGLGEGWDTGIDTITNRIAPTVHKAGHFPIQWMIEANERASQSEKMITIQLEREGVTVIGQEGDNYETHTLAWTMMDKAETNPVILGIETVEKHLDTLRRLKQRVRAQTNA